MHKPVVSTMLSKALEENPVAYRRRQHNLNTFDFEAHNLPPILHLLVWSERSLWALYIHSFRYGEFHAGRERIEYANFLSVDSHVTDQTGLPSTTQFSFLIQFSNASNASTMADPPSSEPE
jgi:hypothetical protein